MRAEQRHEFEVGGVRITHPEKIIYSETRISKGEVAEYYGAIAPFILPELKNRLLTVVRCPQGQKGGCFYQKHPGFGDELPRIKVPEKTGGKSKLYSYIASPKDLLHAVQMNVLEFHAWGSRVPKYENPDRVIFDLDPGPGVSHTVVVETAQALKSLLEELKLRSFVRVSGGKGLHIVVPIKPIYDWAAVKEWSRAFAELLATERKGLVIDALKSKRNGKIFVDYLRNARGATTVSSFSLRARPGASVAMPIEWEELTGGIEFDGYSMRRVLKLVHGGWRDPWKGIEKTAQRLPHLDAVH